ncbi:MAG: RelA/SpoT domain-containing protein [Stenotrophomonas maltophilia]|uniref:RelA/SpoT domain-containing protein n=1 Tax=Stenotrophomonas sp. GD04024 TaxID=2975422 RepID=UPI001311CDD3|nr:RelA/SpoT domain-containing protein [Stenotrophomonas sp. GD04024]MBS4802587.1 RelA/SpoT domain-containing protein [Stenotrophomonas maltophilia]MDG9989075.1 RelA/SpoT domain-containing protein [Stenotrophomonas sp. GD04024]
MGFVKLEYTRGQIRRAGEILYQGNPEQIAAVMPIITNWRAAHAYPLNTFQATLRQRLKKLGNRTAERSLVGERLKRLPSIEAKLHRQRGMKLERMQDVAGLRAVVPDISALKKIHEIYCERALRHELRNTYDYVQSPKEDGYRSIHLVYRYESAKAPQYNGLSVELQLRTRLQHAWATAVETVDIFAKQAIKAGRPHPDWARFFKLASAAFAIQEGTPPHEDYRGLGIDEISKDLAEAERNLDVLFMLRGFRIAADSIQNGRSSPAAYHLVVLNTETRMLKVTQFSESKLDEANESYAAVEELAAQGQPLNPVLVAGGTIHQLRRTYPNYFLDAGVFIDRVSRLCEKPRHYPTARVNRIPPAPPSLSTALNLPMELSKLNQWQDVTASAGLGSSPTLPPVRMGSYQNASLPTWLTWTSFITSERAAELIPPMRSTLFDAWNHEERISGRKKRIPITRVKSYKKFTGK